MLVSFKDQTLQLMTLEEEPLTQWALAAIQLGAELPDGHTYHPTSDLTEQLVISDREMNEALFTVCGISAETAKAPRTKWGRYVAALGVAAALLAVGLLAPDWVDQRARNLADTDRTTAISERIINSGPMAICRDETGNRVLARLAGTQSNVRIGRGMRDEVLVLPDGRVVIDHRAVEELDFEAELSALIAHATTNDQPGKATQIYFDRLGFWNKLGFVATSGAFVPIVDVEAFAVTPETGTPDSMDGVLSDQEWRALKNICGE